MSHPNVSKLAQFQRSLRNQGCNPVNDLKLTEGFSDETIRLPYTKSLQNQSVVVHARRIPGLQNNSGLITLETNSGARYESSYGLFRRSEEPVFLVEPGEANKAYSVMLTAELFSVTDPVLWEGIISNLVAVEVDLAGIQGDYVAVQCDSETRARLFNFDIIPGKVSYSPNPLGNFRSPVNGKYDGSRIEVATVADTGGNFMFTAKLRTTAPGNVFFTHDDVVVTTSEFIVGGEAIEFNIADGQTHVLVGGENDEGELFLLVDGERIQEVIEEDFGFSTIADTLSLGGSANMESAFLGELDYIHYYLGSFNEKYFKYLVDPETNVKLYY